MLCYMRSCTDLFFALFLGLEAGDGVRLQGLGCLVCPTWRRTNQATKLTNHHPPVADSHVGLQVLLTVLGWLKGSSEQFEDIVPC